MPWSPADSIGKTHKADTPEKQKLWSTVANRVLAHTGNEASAVKIANSVIKHHPHPGDKKNEDPRDRYIHWSKR